LRASNEQRKNAGSGTDEVTAPRGLSQALILEKAVPPYRPARPNRPLNIALGAVAGVFLGGIAGLIFSLLAWIKQRRLTSAATTQRHGRFAFGLFLAGTLGTL